MKVIHFDSGLGNQMLSYCEYLAVKRMHPDEACYLETIVYEIPEADSTICQWNGFELERIFGIKDPNIREIFSDDTWEEVKREIQESKFWEKDFNWPIYFNQVFSDHGLKLKNLRGDFESNSKRKKSVLSKVKNTRLYEGLAENDLYQRIKLIMKSRRYVSQDYQKELFVEEKEDAYLGQRLTFKFRDSGIERIEQEIRSVFCFPEFTDERDKALAKELRETDSVAIHARRGDMLYTSKKYYTGGFFRRAVHYIKKKVSNPVFYIFSDPGSIEWCVEHPRMFGLDFKKDKVFFVDWHSGEESYRDMQLMAQCKHNIITNSSFGWWGAFLNNNPGKITISPEIEINTTWHC